MKSCSIIVIVFTLMINTICPNNYALAMVNNTKPVDSASTKDAISEKEIGELTLELINTTGCWDNVEPFFPYMTSDQVKEVVDRYIQLSGNTEQAKEASSKYIGQGSIKNKRKNLTREIVNNRALEVMNLTGNWDYVVPLLPYMTAEAVDECVSLYQQKTGKSDVPKEASPYISEKKENSKGDHNNILAGVAIDKDGNIDFSLVKKMKKSEVDKLALIYIKTTEDFSYVYNLRQYMSTKGIDKAVATYIKKSGDYGLVGAMLEFMSKKASKSLAKKYFEEYKNGEYDWIYEPYL